MNQREIKFRTWDSIANVMYEPFELKEIMISKEAPGMAEHYIYLQFTSLKDKNGKGKEVYHGDLIRACPNGYEPREIYEVVWDEERLEWGVKNKIGIITSLWTFDKDFEIIGDIYSNPELLKS